MYKKYLFYLGHPAHYHLFRHIIVALHKKGHQVRVLISSKDVLEILCKADSFDYITILSKRRKNNYFSIGASFLKKLIRITRVINNFKPNLLIGSEPTLTHLGFVFRIPSMIFSEDDVAIIPQFANIAYPFVDHIVSPASCNAGKWERKKIAYNGFHKYAYLHPSLFVPDRSLIEGDLKSNYFILRLADLSAYHDKNKTGLDRKLVRKVIGLLKPHGSVYISSERELEPEFEEYRLAIKPQLIHHVLYFAKLYVGDSQSMAVESALLGTPGIRFNDFAGEIGVLNELENIYNLTTSVKTNKPDNLLLMIKKILSNPAAGTEYRKRRNVLIREIINVPLFFIWLLDEYPQSVRILKKKPAYTNKFI
jgi:uncharacterized protein